MCGLIGGLPPVESLTWNFAKEEYHVFLGNSLTFGRDETCLE